MKFIKRLIVWLMQKKLSKLDSLYQKHAGEECYIFGDGMSLKWMDITQFNDRPAIFGNFSIYHKDSNAINATYCTIVEPYFFYPFFPYWGQSGLKILKHYLHVEYLKTIKEKKKTLFFLNISNAPVVRFSNTIFVQKSYRPPFEEKNPFLERQDSHDGTLKFQLSLAIFLGFKKAYLVGHDYTHSPARNLHYYEKGEGIFRDTKGFSGDFLEYAKQHIELVAVTLEGGSETLDSVTYTELTGKTPLFQENTEIVPMEKLKCLAKWHDYSIF
jgi:hypothetical protein